MKNTSFIIPIFCGFLATLLLAAPLWSGIPIISSLMFASPMPIFFAVLSQGTRAGIIAGITGVLATMIYIKTANVILTSLILFLPPIWIGHMVGLAKDSKELFTIWYPSELILDYITFIAFLISAILFYVLGFNIEFFTQEISNFFQQYKEIVEANDDSNNLEINPQEIAENMTMWIYIILPASFAILFIFNLLFAARLAKRFGGMLRPREDFVGDLTIDPVTSIIFIPILLVALFGSNILFTELLHFFRLMAASMAFCYFIVGLCVIHFVRRFFKMPRFVLLFPYILMMFGIPIFLVAILGFMESIASIRRYITL